MYIPLIFNLLVVLTFSCNDKSETLVDFETRSNFKFPENIEIDTIESGRCIISFNESTESLIIKKIHHSKIYDPKLNLENKMENHRDGELMKGFWVKNNNGYIFWKYFNENNKLTDYAIEIDTLKNIGILSIEISD